ncbi:MAG: UDP-N-acetylmuramoyl-dipeptide--2,6-diaminopimelate ligase [Rhodanobacteraceae bacterium]|jgi:UDP-N-acetylmuramoyl-L-alanyl-D-glutamate--2,6-diaminopimelate ligase|nr:MAG: UDP-N-acetylmuramoyl-dipeptide--2,6-diaminopimelate ligase [Rhodanobacteraceae bacterium]
MSAMRLDELLRGIATPEYGDIVVSGLTQDSHAVRAGDAFVALAGRKYHGIEFARATAAQGAVAVLAEPPIPDSRFPIPVIETDNLRARLGAIAARFYGDPSASMTVIGVTGTSGKTSTVQLLAQALTRLGRRTATIGTLGAGLHGALHAGERTTPDVIRVHGLMAEFRDAGATHVAMEVSSHALDQRRVDGVHFDVAVFTNLTRDHLDYHGTMEAYGAAKAKLFAWPGLRAAVINVDDPFGRELAEKLPAGVDKLRCAIGRDDAELHARNVRTHSDGLDFELETPWGIAALHSRLLGRFNVANLLAVAGVLGALGVPFARITAALEALEPVAGRMNRLGGGALPLVVVDYSHKPDALEQVLATLREHCDGVLICVFGCGGERDAGKRPLMGAIAERLADLAIVTDDNPRGEDGDAIAAQIVAGMRAPERAVVERDRARAIDLAIARAQAGDVVLVAGKGHETYQEVAGTKRPFDDLKVARAALEAHAC